MNKAVLFLINGLGIEKKDSCNIYSSDIMPNFDNLTKSPFFTTVSAPANNIIDAYKYFSIGTMEPLEQPFFKNVLDNEELTKNEKFNQLQKEVFNCNGKIHLFCFLNDDKVIDSIKSFIKVLDPNELKKFYIHFVLTHESDKDFYQISKILDKYQYALSKNIERAMVIGKNVIQNNDKITDLNEYVRILYNGVGEKWKDVDSKLNALFGVHANPSDTKGFYINDGLTISNDDLFIIFNYENYDFSLLENAILNPPIYLNVQNSISHFNAYSLFPMKNTQTIKPLYENIISDISISKAMEQIGGTALVLIDKENVNMVNFMANGLTNNSNSHVKYVLTDNGITYLNQQMTTLINDPTYQLIIINHSIDNIDDINQMKEQLTKIDSNLQMIVKICEDKVPLIVSSLYGLKKEINIDFNKKDLVNFNGKVPAIIIDSKINSKKSAVTSGDTYSLFSTCLKFIKPELRVPSLIRQKSFLESVIKK